MEQNVEMAVVENKKEVKVVVDPSIARKLLKSGFTIIDIKGKKSYPRETVFCFKVEDGFMETLENLMNEKKNKD